MISRFLRAQITLVGQAFFLLILKFKENASSPGHGRLPEGWFAEPSARGTEPEPGVGGGGRRAGASEHGPGRAAERRCAARLLT